MKCSTGLFSVLATPLLAAFIVSPLSAAELSQGESVDVINASAESCPLLGDHTSQGACPASASYQGALNHEVSLMLDSISRRVGSAQQLNDANFSATTLTSVERRVSLFKQGASTKYGNHLDVNVLQNSLDRLDSAVEALLSQLNS